MIGRIAGVILHRAMDHVLIDVRGVGYIVHVSQRTAAALPPVGEVVALYTDLLVREDLLQLFGFPTLLEKEWHRLLMSVQGVGAKASMAILGTLGADLFSALDALHRAGLRHDVVGGRRLRRLGRHHRGRVAAAGIHHRRIPAAGFAAIGGRHGFGA